MTGTGIRRVWFVATDPDRLGGVSSFITVLGRALAGRGYEIRLLGVEQPRGNYPLIRPADWQQTVLFPTQAERDADPELDAHAYGLERFAAVKADWGPEDLIICCHVWPMEIMIAGGLNPRDRTGPVIIGQYHGSFHAAESGRDLRRIKKIFKDVDQFCCLTEADTVSYRRAGLNNVIAMPNPVPLNDARDGDRDKVVVSLGRYSPEKSLDHLIKAWRTVTERHPDWRLRLYGAGPKEPLLRELIDRLGLGDVVTLDGIAADVGGVLARSSLHAMSSQTEGLPISIIEAAMAGVPTVTYDSSPGIRAIVRDGATGRIVPKNDVDALAAAFGELIEDADLRTRLGSAARAEAEQYAPEPIADRWEDLMRTALR
ncbi:glycosyltransferase [Microlunatus speluncae]|uniref:glycosyltransferase n=1 Tax=Microlunatus speluncae TaxID=2594267 RepID=UPI0012661D1B|nr:glycosyltransferase [Microlunatus speluncae]